MATDTMPEVVAVEDFEEIAGEMLYEVVGGCIEEKSKMGAYPGELGYKLGRLLGNHVEDHALGKVVGEIIFRLDDDNQRRPDVAFLSRARWPKGKRSPLGDPWDVVPDLAVEVISQTDQAWKVMSKVQLYFESGVRAVWLVYPIQEMVMLFDSLKSIRVYTRKDVLEGGVILPEFQLPLDSFFEDDEAVPEGA